MVVLTLLGTLYALPAVLDLAREGRPTLVDARSAFERDPDDARPDFERARSIFGSAESRLGTPLLIALRALPVVGEHVRVGRSLAAMGADVADAGLAGVSAVNALPEGELPIASGRIDFASLRKAVQAFRPGFDAAAQLLTEVQGMPSGWVVGSLADARHEALEVLPGVVAGIEKARVALEGMPSYLAEKGQRRYVIAFSTLAELRGTGGFIGYVTMLDARNGKLDIGALSGKPSDLFPPPAEAGVSFPDWFPDNFKTQSGIFQNINLTSDFPTVGSFITQTASKVAGQVDGVIGVDPIGISALLKLVGPIKVPSWPEPITSENVSRVAQNEVYARIDDEAQQNQFFAELVRTAFNRLTSARVRLRPETVGPMDAAVRGGHLRMFSTNDNDQSTFRQLGLSGALDRTTGATDVVSVVSQNAVPSKGDWYLRKQVSYRVRLHPDDAIARSDLTVELQNTSPSSGLPDDILGEGRGGLTPGTNRQLLMLLRPPSNVATFFRRDDDVVPTQRAAEGPVRAYSVRVVIPPKKSASVRMVSTVEEAFSGSGRHRTYRLHLMPQPVAHPDRYAVVVEPVKGWAIGGQTRFSGDLTSDVVMEVRLTQSWGSWFVDKAFVEPWRLIRSIGDKIWPF